jgi:hypothetical protein
VAVGNAFVVLSTLPHYDANYNYLGTKSVAQWNLLENMNLKASTPSLKVLGAYPYLPFIERATVRPFDWGRYGATTTPNEFAKYRSQYAE